MVNKLEWSFDFFRSMPYLRNLKKERPCKASLFSSETPEKYNLKFRFHGKKSVDNTLRRFLTKNILSGSAEIRSVEIL